MDLAQGLLSDTYVRWTQAQMLEYLSDGEVEATALKPPAYITSTVVGLVAGTRQALPVRAVELFRVAEALDAAGSVRPAPKVVATERLNDILPAWRQARTDSVAQYVAYDVENPLLFEVYPPQPDTGTGSVRLVCFATPPAFGVVTDTLHLAEAYHPALVDYLLYRCYQVDTDPASAQRAEAHYAAFAAKVKAVVPRETAQ